MPTELASAPAGTSPLVTNGMATRATVTDGGDGDLVELLLDDGTRRTTPRELVQGVRRLATGQRLLVEMDGDEVVGARLEQAVLAVHPRA